jgi:hypothetical protein
MLKKPASAKTVSREASLVKRISQGMKFSACERRDTRYERRTTDEEDGLFEHPAAILISVPAKPLKQKGAW